MTYRVTVDFTDGETAEYEAVDQPKINDHMLILNDGRGLLVIPYHNISCFFVEKEGDE